MGTFWSCFVGLMRLDISSIEFNQRHERRGVAGLLESPQPRQDRIRSLPTKPRIGQRMEFCFDLGVGQRIAGVAARIIHPLAQLAPPPRTARDKVTSGFS